MAKKEFSQNEKIYRYLKAHGSITQREALYLGCMRLASRINELRKIVDIKTEMVKVRNQDGSSSMVARYYLEEEGGEDQWLIF